MRSSAAKAGRGGLVRDRDRHVRARGERLDQRPLGSGQVLEPVGEDGLPTPGSEIALDPLGRAAAHAVPIPESPAGRARRGIRWPVGRARLLRLQDREAPIRAPPPRTAAHRRTHSTSTTRRDLRARSPRSHAAPRARAVHRSRHHAVRDLPPRSARRDRRTCRCCRQAAPADVAEGRARRARRPFDWVPRARDRVRARRDSARGAGRPCRHAPARRRARDPSVHGNPGLRPLFVRGRPLLRKERETPVTVTHGDGHRASLYVAVTAFGLRPRRATAWPGMPPAQSSQRSACFEPLRASVKLRRMSAPLPSATSFEHLSQTRIVFRATILPP